MTTQSILELQKLKMMCTSANFIKSAPIYMRLLFSLPEIITTLITVVIMILVFNRDLYKTEEKKKEILKNIQDLASGIFVAVLIYLIIKMLMAKFIKSISFGLSDISLLIQVLPFAFILFVTVNKKDEDGVEKNETDYIKTIENINLIVASSLFLQGLLRVRLLNCTVI